MVDLLNKQEWVARRVDTVELLDDVLVRQRVTVDVRVDDVIDSANYWAFGDGDILRNPSLVPVPLAVIKKDLLMDFDLIDPSGAKVAAPTREEDSYAAACALFALANDILQSNVHERPRQRMFDVAYAFEHETDDLLRAPASWENEPSKQWAALAADDRFGDLLGQFAESFVLFGRANDSDTGTNLYKFSYLAPITVEVETPEALGLRPISFELPVKGAEACRSYHLRFAAPLDLEVESLSPNGDPEQWDGYWKRAHNRAHAYLTAIDADVASLTVSLRSVPSQFLRTAMLSSWMVLLIQVLVLVLSDEIGAIVEQGGADAAIAVLLVLPTVISTYVARPGSHRLSNRALTWPRILIGFSALFPYITAGHLLLEQPPSTVFLRVLAVASAGVAFHATLSWVLARRNVEDRPVPLMPIRSRKL